MAKVKYYYDPDTLSYRRIVPKKGRKLGLVALFIMGTVLSGFLFYIATSYIPEVKTPRVLGLERNLKNAELNYKILNKKLRQMELVLENMEDRDNNIYRIYFEASPIPDEQRKAGFGGVNRYDYLEGFDNSEMIIKATKRLETMQKRMVVQSKSLDEIAELAKDKQGFLAAIPAIQPISAEDLTRMASGYGWRSDPFTKIRKFHYGMDFTAPKGTPVYASGDGYVEQADNTAAGYGEHIRVNHGYGYVSLYAHLSRYNVRKGQRVKRGQIIGFVGSTGRSEAPHLHYEVFKDGERINPINFYYGSLTAEQFEAMLKAAALENQSLD